MKLAFDKINELIERNAKHRQGWKMKDASPALALRHASDELVELTQAVINPHKYCKDDHQKELADVLSCLFHFAIMDGLTWEEVEHIILKKLDDRFEIGDPCNHDKRFGGVMGAKNGCLACELEKVQNRLSALEADVQIMNREQCTCTGSTSGAMNCPVHI